MANPTSGVQADDAVSAAKVDMKHEERTGGQYDENWSGAELLQ